MNELKKYDVIKAVHFGKKTKKRACVELALSLRQVNRLLKNYALHGKAAFSHKNKDKTPKHALSQTIKDFILTLYQSFDTHRPNVVHFKEILEHDYGICLSDTTIRNLLYKNGMASPKSHRATIKRLKKINKKSEKKKVSHPTAHLPKADDFLEKSEQIHPSRPRKKYCGELIQMDASEFIWFGKTKAHLHVAIDDASGNIVGAYFDTQETLNGYYNVLYQLLTHYGIPVTLHTDKRSVFTYQKKSEQTIQEDSFTQFGFACFQLGIELTASSIPQSKGRVERLNNTLQSRLPVDLARHHITTIEEANNYLKRWIKSFNKQFGSKAHDSVYEVAPTQSQLNLILARVCERKIDAGHHIRFKNQSYLPIKQSKDIYFTRHTKALVIEAFDGTIFLNVADTIYPTRLLLAHELHSETFDRQEDIKKERRRYIPPQSHPWKLASFKKYLKRLGKTLEDYQADKLA